jgi:hypothetical protein
MLENNIIAVLENTNGSTIARLSTTTQVKTAAKFNVVNIKKTTVSSVLLFGKVSAYKNAYLRRVKKTAAEIEGNTEKSIDNFQLSDNWHKASEKAYSVRFHAEKGTKYLFPMYCKAGKTSFTINGNPATRLEVADYLTPSERKKLLDDSGIIENKKNGVKHSAIVRTISMDNINYLKIKGQIITA